MIKRTLCCLLEVQIYSDSILISLHKIDGFAHFWRIFFCKIEYVEFCLEFLVFWKKSSEKLSKADAGCSFYLCPPKKFYLAKQNKKQLNACNNTCQSAPSSLGSESALLMFSLQHVSDFIKKVGQSGCIVTLITTVWLFSSVCFQIAF